MTFYIIDNNETDLFVCQKLLERRNRYFIIEVCQNPVLALDQLLDEAIHPDVILLDWYMPALNADEWLACYMQLIDVSTPVYILTSSIDPHDELKAGRFKTVKVFFPNPCSSTILMKS